MRGNLCFLLQVKFTMSCPEAKEGQISLQRLNVGSSFISQDERISEFPVETIQKALGLPLISTGGLIYFCLIDRHEEFSASKVEGA